jgi:hypothetical protein
MVQSESENKKKEWGKKNGREVEKKRDKKRTPARWQCDVQRQCMASPTAGRRIEDAEITGPLACFQVAARNGSGVRRLGLRQQIIGHSANNFPKTDISHGLPALTGNEIEIPHLSLRMAIERASPEADSIVDIAVSVDLAHMFHTLGAVVGRSLPLQALCMWCIHQQTRSCCNADSQSRRLFP